MADQKSDLPDDLIDTAHAARIARSNIRTVFRWIITGKVQGWRRCGRWFVSRADIVALFEPAAAVTARPARLVPTRREHTRRQRQAQEFLRERGIV